MSSLQSQYVIPGITEMSSVAEMIAVLYSSFRKKEYDEVERLLIRHETKLGKELSDLRERFDLLQQGHSRAVLEEIVVREELKECRAALHESLEQVNRLKALGEMLCKRDSKSRRQVESVAEELMKMEEQKDAEMAKKIQELTKTHEETLEKLRLDKQSIIEDLMSQVALLQERDGKELGVEILHNTSDHCQLMNAKVEGGLPVFSPEVINQSVSPQEISNGENGVNDQVGGESKENLDQTSLRAIKEAIAPVAVTNQSLSALEVGAGVNGVNEQIETRNLDQITLEAFEEVIRPLNPFSFSELTLSPLEIIDCETQVNEHNLKEAVAPLIHVPFTNGSSSAQEIIEIVDSEDESDIISLSQTQDRKRRRLDSDPIVQTVFSD